MERKKKNLWNIEIIINLGFACHRSFDRGETLLIFTCIGWALTIYYCIIKRFVGKAVYNSVIKPSVETGEKLWSFWFVRL